MRPSRKGILFNTGRTHFKVGHTPWNKGLTYKQREGTGEKISSALKGHKNWYFGRYTKEEVKLRRSFREKQRELRKVVNGTHTYEDWLYLKKIYGYMCLCCKKCEPEIKLTEDHIIPLSKGGTNKIENIQPLCLLCNMRKHTDTISYLPSDHNGLFIRRQEANKNE